MTPSKPVPISSLRPGDLCHFIDRLPGDELRVNFYRVAKNRKPRASAIMNGAIVVPIMAYGFSQGGKCTFRAKKPSHLFIDGRLPVVKRTKANWKPRGK